MGLKKPQHQCIHCGHQTTKNAVRGLSHLDQCDAYKQKITKKEDASFSSRSIQLPITTMIRPLSQSQIAHAHREAAMSVYMTNLPFNHFENPYVIAAFQALSPGYKPPHARLMAGRLLDEAYETVKFKINQELNACNHLSFFTDETANIRKERVINLCCHVPTSVTSSGGGFQLKADVGVAEKMTAVVQAEWVINGCRDATNNQLERVNCICTDTCSTMKAMWTEISKSAEMKHVFFVPCDSHGLQLLLGDILKFPYFTDVIEKAQLIVISFRGSNKELASLWKYQMKAYKQRRSLVLNFLTRWGTTVGLLNSVLNNQQALLGYFQQKNPGIDQGRNKPLGSFVNDYSFWKKLTMVKKILNPIHKLQYMSEAEGYKLYTVTNNWNIIRSHLYSMAEEESDSEADLYHIAHVVWEDRYLSQITELHVVASLLLPQNRTIKVVGVTTEHAFSSIMHRFFARYLNAEDSIVAMRQWLAFRDQEDEFHANSECWTYQMTPELFWNFCKHFALILSKLARKVMMLPGNSVLAERSWSVMNLIMNKTRNSMASINVDKLMFIYLNERTLNRPKEIKRKLQFAGIDIEEDDLYEMEDRLLQEEISLQETATVKSLKRPASQAIEGDAVRLRDT